MKVLGVTVLVLLCAGALCSLPKGGRTDDDMPTCCFSYTSEPRKILLKHVRSYFKTSSQCPNPAVVFVTKRGWLICANPSDAWVQDYISNMEEVPPVVQ